MATAKMLRRIRKAFDWIDHRKQFNEQILVRHDWSKPGRETREEVTARIREAADEREALRQFYAEALEGKSDRALIESGLGELLAYREWRHGSASRVVPLPRSCPRCDNTGYEPVADMEGHYDGAEPCSCPRGRRILFEVKAQFAGVPPHTGPLF